MDVSNTPRHANPLRECVKLQPIYCSCLCRASSYSVKTELLVKVQRDCEGLQRSQDYRRYEITHIVLTEYLCFKLIQSEIIVS